ncbi:Glutamyl-tRNA(Gln) amidotransferase subunit A [compost metagenome]
MVTLMAEAYAVHEKALQQTPELFGEFLRLRLYLAALLSSADYVQAGRRRRELCAACGEALSGVDVLFTATTPAPAPLIDELGWDYTFRRPSLTMPFNLTGSPVLATRAGFSASGLPLSFQLVGRHFDEATILALGHQYEQATDWAGTRPSAYPLAAVQAEAFA